MGGRGAPVPLPRTLRSTEMLSTRAPSGKSMPRKKMSLQPLCVRSMRTGVASCRMGNSPCSRAVCDIKLRIARAAGGRRDGRCGTSTGCRARSARCAAPGRRASGSRAGDRPRPARWPAVVGHAAVRLLRGEEQVDGFLEAAFEQVGIAVEGDQPRSLLGQHARQVKAIDGIEEKERPDALIEVVALAAERVQRGAFGQQVRRACPAAIRRPG